MAVELLSAGGCYNSGRFALDGAGANVRNWRGAIDTDQVFTNTETLIVAVSMDADDMNEATDATFKLRWRNVTDAGSMADLASSGEIKWSTSSDLVDDQGLIEAEFSGGNSVDCVGKEWTTFAANAQEVEGANGKTITVPDDEIFEIQWAIDLSSADFANGDQYEFAITESGGGAIGTLAGKLTVVEAGKIDGTTKNDDRTSAVVSVQVTCWLSDEASPPKPTGDIIVQLISSGSDGTYSLTGLVKDNKYFLHFFKDDTADLSDGSIEVTAVGV